MQRWEASDAVVGHAAAAIWAKRPLSPARCQGRPSHADHTTMSRRTYSPSRRIRLAAPSTSALARARRRTAGRRARLDGDGTVLAVGGHRVELVGAGDAVRGYRYGARFPAVGFGTGSPTAPRETA